MEEEEEGSEKDENEENADEKMGGEPETRTKYLENPYGQKLFARYVLLIE